MEVSYATMEAMGMLIQRLGQDARRLEKALAETMHTSAEWKRIADELKAERDAAKQEAMLARQRIDGLMIQAQDMRAEIERLKKPAHCTPCDPPTASHDTPEGKRTAEGAVTPQPGDVVILVRFPTPKECREWSDEFGKIGELATVMSDDDEPCPFCVSVVRSEGCMNWPLSCVEVVNGVDK
jgi:hypothetical protein